MTVDLEDTADDPSARRDPPGLDSESPIAGEGTSSPDPDVEVEALLDLLGDEYACAIIRALADGPRTARDLTGQVEMSRPTVYRRLDRLRDAGIVRSTTRPETDGHHRQEFHLVVDGIQLQLCADGIDGTVSVTAPAGD